MRVTVVVVNHNSAPEIFDCLRSVAGRPAIVVDNASTDGSAEAIEREHPDVRLIRAGRNGGFGAGANIGVRAASTPYVFVLNPDATVADGAIERLAVTLDERPLAAAAGPLVRNPDGSVQPSKRAFPRIWHSLLHSTVGIVWPGNPGTRAYLLADRDLAGPATVGWVSASAVMYRRDAFLAAGGFDERFFFFMEDVDLCKTFVERGLQNWFDPRAEVVHAWGGSWTKRPLRFIWMHHRNMFRYVLKHHRGVWMFGYPFLALGIGLRGLLMTIRWLVWRRAVPGHRAHEEVRR